MTGAHRDELPEWAREASLGIFIHWGPYSVPARAEVGNTFGDRSPTGEAATVTAEAEIRHRTRIGDGRLIVVADDPAAVQVSAPGHEVVPVALPGGDR
ncbi:alpha-L-fucosidase [Glycomyces luteolus]|uniref:Alpha-L-fucosidase n=1 Tax=Glycomyces luteolus TaxID=2670330 RepID=A0A9X3PCL7_9ACTN|nr:alpha-L-fucosidase [Glycomyces luteolus]MDA1361043.1 alpha-L-fucosidase [Glycomyces luteolus]